ncbi:Major sperm protein [Cynara cardunculus var. scolymus]|uniref:Major sperm protein n=1 Tax=Cynara cardunculus var. scolymus TaxID=59895 RepID=A0A103XJW1_CYNCS|nr:Major sperm protein [Cynara cardunculus var. scolymus]
MSTGELVSVDPVELKFPFELNKQISSSLQLTNKTDNHVGFKVKTTNPKKYCVRPNTGVVLPRSTCEIMDAPPDMQCKDKFLLQSVVASPGATPKDITPEMFAKDSGRVVEECKLRVVYFPATPSTSAAIAQGTVDDVFSPKASPRASASRRYVRALISQLTDEKNAAIEQSNKIRKELEVLRQASNKSEGGGVSLIVAIIIALIGLILGYIMKN